MKRFLFFVFLLSFAANAQDDFAIDAVRQTLPAYLDQNANSAFSMIAGGKNHRLFQEIADDSGNGDDFRKTIDSLKSAVKGKKVKVIIDKNWHCYDYAPDAESWAYDKEMLREDFQENALVRLDHTIDVAYIDLIRKQIDSKFQRSPLAFDKLENPRYSFSDEEIESDGNPMVFNGLKLYRPVFNADKTKGCYLFSYACMDGYCRDFIFIEFKKGKWHYVADYPSHLIDGKDEE